MEKSQTFLLALILLLQICFSHSNKRNILSEPAKTINGDPISISFEILQSDNLGTIYIGDQGTFSLVTNYNDTEENIFDASDIEKETFTWSIFMTGDKDGYYAYCRLWKPLNEKINLICKFEINLIPGTYSATLNEAIFYYKEYVINIISKEPITIKQLDKPLPFLYSNY